MFHTSFSLIVITGAEKVILIFLLPDLTGQVGVRRNPQNPDKKEKIFGYNAVLSTSVELHLHIELPVAVTNIAGNAEEGDMLIANRKQILDHHPSQVLIDIADVHPVK